MALHLLDTTALVDFSKGIEPVGQRLLSMIAAGESLGVCAINVTEFYAGVRPAAHRLWDAFMDELFYWEISREAAVQAGAYRYDYARQGVSIGIQDAIIAAVAVEIGATILTDNPKHFPMPEVSTRSLRH